VVEGEPAARRRQRDGAAADAVRLPVFLRRGEQVVVRKPGRLLPLQPVQGAQGQGRTACISAADGAAAGRECGYWLVVRG
jgi:hypothetical protein